MIKEIHTQFSPNEISDTISIAIIVLDESLRVRQMNAAAENLFGQSRARILNKPYSVILHEDLMKDQINFVLKNEEPRAVRGCYLKGQQKKNIIVDCVASPLVKNTKLQGVVLELY